jgi:uncharacterized repeat protein (TIGR02543 family)
MKGASALLRLLLAAALALSGLAGAAPAWAAEPAEEGGATQAAAQGAGEEGGDAAATPDGDGAATPAAGPEGVSSDAPAAPAAEASPEATPAPEPKAGPQPLRPMGSEQTDGATGLVYEIWGEGQGGADCGPGAYVVGYEGGGTGLAVPASLGGSPVVSVNLPECGLTSLDVTACTDLANLNCERNSLASLDVSRNTALVYLYCLYNGTLAELDVGGLTGLTGLWCDDNSLASLDVSGNPALTILSCERNSLAELDVSRNAALMDLSCGGNSLAELDVGGLAALRSLYCQGNRLTSLDVSGNTALAYLQCSYNSLAELNVGGLAKLTGLWCQGNSLASLDVGGSPALAQLCCFHNRIPDSDARRALVARFGSGSVLPQDVPDSAALSVAFDSRGGSAVAGRSVAPGSAVGSLPRTSRTGHSFAGWFTAPSGGTQVTASTVVTGDVTYYAQWRANTCTVKFDANGGKVSGKAAASVKRAYGQALGSLAKATRTGYDFLGWFTGKVKGTKVGAGTKVTKNVTYYAHWKAKGPVVTLNANGGKMGKAAATSKVYPKGKALGKLATPTRSGYSFLGWFTAKAKGEKVTAKTKATRNITLYAHWKAKTYTVRLDANGGKVGKAATSSLKKAYNAKLGKLAVPKRGGHQFLGWYTKKSGGQKVTPYTKVTKPVTLYAHWRRAR